MECLYCDAVFPSNIYYFYNQRNFQIMHTSGYLRTVVILVFSFLLCVFTYLLNFLKLKKKKTLLKLKAYYKKKAYYIYRHKIKQTYVSLFFQIKDSNIYEHWRVIIYIYTHTNIYIHMYMCVCVCIYIQIYIYTVLF